MRGYRIAIAKSKGNSYAGIEVSWKERDFVAYAKEYMQKTNQTSSLGKGNR